MVKHNFAFIGSSLVCKFESIPTLRLDDGRFRSNYPWLNCFIVSCWIVTNLKESDRSSVLLSFCIRKGFRFGPLILSFQNVVRNPFSFERKLMWKYTIVRASDILSKMLSRPKYSLFKYQNRFIIDFNYSRIAPLECDNNYTNTNRSEYHY